MENLIIIVYLVSMSICWSLVGGLVRILLYISCCFIDSRWLNHVALPALISHCSNYQKNTPLPQKQTTDTTSKLVTSPPPHACFALTEINTKEKEKNTCHHRAEDTACYRGGDTKQIEMSHMFPVQWTTK